MRRNAAALIRAWLAKNAISPWVVLLWVAAVVSMAAMFVMLPENGWDLRVTSEAMKYVRAGQDPYAVSLALQKAEAARGHERGEAELGHRVFVYIYPPISLEFLKILNLIPAWLRGVIFWTLYVFGFGLQLWAGSRFALASEWRVLQFVLPLVMFFPAFVPSDTLVSGNMAIPMYGAILATAVRGWRGGGWRWFFVVVIAASLMKPPMLLWLMVPLLVDFSQFVPTVSAGTLGVGLFAVQRFVWPERFAEFTSSIAYTLPLEINYSIVAKFKEVLKFIGHPSDRAASVFYVTVCLAVFGGLVYFARECQRGKLRRENFAVVLFVSIAMFMPRLKEYDLLPLTIPMTLIVLRAWRKPVALILLVAGAIGVAAVLLADQVTHVDTISVTTVFLVGIYGLRNEAHTTGLGEISLAAQTTKAAQ